MLIKQLSNTLYYVTILSSSVKYIFVTIKWIAEMDQMKLTVSICASMMDDHNLMNSAFGRADNPVVIAQMVSFNVNLEAAFHWHMCLMENHTA